MDVKTLAKETVKQLSEGMSEKEIKLLEETLVKNYEPIFKEMTAQKKIPMNDNTIDALIKAKGAGLSSTEKEKARTMLKDVCVEGKSPAESMELNKSILDWSYMNAYKQYQTGNFNEAIPTLRVLEWLDPSRFEFGFALAACYQMSKDYENAIFCYMKLAVNFPENPLPLFHAADCFKQKKLHNVAFATLQEVIKRCGEDPRYSKIKEKSQLFSDVEKELTNQNIQTKVV